MREFFIYIESDSGTVKKIHIQPDDGLLMWSKHLAPLNTYTLISMFHRAFFNSIMDKTPTHALFYSTLY